MPKCVPNQADCAASESAALTKRCTKCGEEKPLDQFARAASGRFGRGSRCRKCMRQWHQAHYQKHREEFCAQAKADRETRPAYYKARARASYLRNRDQKRGYRLRRKADPTLRAKDAAYKQKYVAAHKDRVMASKRRWIENHRDHQRAIKLAIEVRRRARKLAATTGDPQDIQDFYTRVRTAAKAVCHWCGKLVRKSQRNVDHIVPLSKGGPHSVSNLCCACVFCNSSKWNHMPDEFVRRNGLQQRLFD